MIANMMDLIKMPDAETRVRMDFIVQLENNKRL